MCIYKPKKYINEILLFGICFILEGCQMRKEGLVTLSETLVDSALLETENEKLENVRVTYQPLDFEVLTSLFLGVSEEEAEEYNNPYYPNCYETDMSCFFYDPIYSEYIDVSGGGVGECYYSACQLAEYGQASCWTRDYLPLDSLESCSRDEAIEICKPYAEAFGYTDAEINVYALPVESLNQSYSDTGGHAPDPNYQVVTYREIYKASAEGNDEEFRRLLWERHIMTRQGGRWEEGDEALMLIYRPMLNGKTVYKSSYLNIIYVPGLKKAVKVWGQPALQAAENLDEPDLITEEEAFLAVLAELGLDSPELITIRGISLEYCVSDDILYENEADKMKAVPCWKIDMDLSEEAQRKSIKQIYGTVCVNAVTGQVIII